MTGGQGQVGCIVGKPSVQSTIKRTPKTSMKEIIAGLEKLRETEAEEEADEEAVIVSVRQTEPRVDHRASPAMSESERKFVLACLRCERA
jgi:hypothetical protein